jgi:ribA/ribD-fused uncharacterized protein
MDVLKYRHYQRAECVTFRKTNEKFGGLSNMAAGYPIVLGRIVAKTSEALYQAARFPHRPEVQQLIFEQQSPMTAKMKSKPYRKDSRSDWDHVRTKVMRWTLRAKLYQSTAFRDLLFATGERPIVEDSRNDRFWGAVLTGSDELVGENILGRLLMELREELRAGKHDWGQVLAPPEIGQFLFLGSPAPLIRCEWSETLAADTSAMLFQPVELSASDQPSQDSVTVHDSASSVGVSAHGVAVVIEPLDRPALDGTDPLGEAYGRSSLSATASLERETGLCEDSAVGSVVGTEAASGNVEQMEAVAKNCSAAQSDSTMAPAAVRTTVEAETLESYCELVEELAQLPKNKVADTLREIVESTPEFRPSEFRRTLEQLADRSTSPMLKMHAARILRAHGALLNKLAQRSLL